MEKNDVHFGDEIASASFQVRERLHKAMRLLIENRERIQAPVYESMRAEINRVERSLIDLEGTGYQLAGRNGPSFSSKEC